MIETLVRALASRRIEQIFAVARNGWPADATIPGWPACDLLRRTTIWHDVSHVVDDPDSVDWHRMLNSRRAKT